MERLQRLKDLVDRIERLPESPERDRVLAEVRSRDTARDAPAARAHAATGRTQAAAAPSSAERHRAHAAARAGAHRFLERSGTVALGRPAVTGGRA